MLFPFFFFYLIFCFSLSLSAIFIVHFSFACCRLYQCIWLYFSSVLCYSPFARTRRKKRNEKNMEQEVRFSIFQSPCTVSICALKPICSGKINKTCDVPIIRTDTKWVAMAVLWYKNRQRMRKLVDHFTPAKKQLLNKFIKSCLPILKRHEQSQYIKHRPSHSHQSTC